jgi:hypothetical protein
MIAELGLAAVVIASLAYVAWRFAVTGYLPHPFQSNPAESLMDLYNTAFWAHRPGAYSDWHTVYLPASFVLLRVWTAPACYRSDPYAGRACDPGALAPILAAYVVNMILVFLSLRRIDRRTALPRTLALCAGLPMLYGMDLANLIVPCFTGFVLAYGGLVRPAPLRSLFAALSINLKPYLLVLALPQMAARQGRWLLGVGAAGLGVYLITLAMEGAGSPSDIVKDLFVYAGSMPGLYAARNHLATMAPPRQALWNLIFPALIHLGQAGVASCYALSLIRPRGVDIARFTTLTLTLVCAEAALHTQGYSADYTLVFLIFMIFMQPWDGAPRVALIVSAYLLCISADHLFEPVTRVMVDSYWSRRRVLAEHGPALSQFARPALLLAIQYVLIGLVWRDMRYARGLQRASEPLSAP